MRIYDSQKVSSSPLVCIITTAEDEVSFECLETYSTLNKRRVHEYY